jgi:predicted O-methyltransferase YrrM
MKEDNKYFTIGETSIELVNNIISEMDGKTFHNHYHILYDICESFDKDDLIYLEIGSYCGGSASLVSKSKKVKNVYSIDIGYPINENIPIKNVNKFKHDNCTYEYIKGNSMDKTIVDLVVEKIKNVDVLFIDGDHSEKAVISDFKNYSNLVTKGGYIIFDDYLDKAHSPEVKRAVDSIVRNLNINEFEVIGSLKYNYLYKTNFPELGSSNEFILKKIF